jgi:hypothetical protein
MLYHYQDLLGPGRSFQFYPGDQVTSEGPQWFFAHRFDHDPEPVPAERVDAAGRHYRLVQTYRHAALSGWDWFVYRNVDLLPD